MSCYTKRGVPSAIAGHPASTTTKDGLTAVVAPGAAHGPCDSFHYERVHCPKGVDPFGTVEWVPRIVQIKNDAGETILAQEGVEFPALWSTPATNVVTSKYFYGDLHAGNGFPADGKREYSVRQLVHRVANTITNWGLEKGYFADQESASNYYADLVWLLLHQHGAFNSPVWFNTGLFHEYGITDTGGKRIYWYNPETREVEEVDPYEHYQARAAALADVELQQLLTTPSGLVPPRLVREVGLEGLKVYDRARATDLVSIRPLEPQPLISLETKSGARIALPPAQEVWVSGGTDGGGWVPASEVNVGDRLTLRTRCRSDAGLVGVCASEAALAGWLLSDGFVGQYDQGTNRSLIIEFESISDCERAWVEGHLDRVFPGVHFNRREEETEGDTDYVRLRAYGERFRPFVEAYGLLGRKLDARVPPVLYGSDLESARAFLRSVFECDGYVCLRGGKSKLIGLQRISREFMEGVALLLARFGIFGRIRRKPDPRKNRHDGWCLTIGNQSEIERFEREIGFISDRKRGLLSEAVALGGRGLGDTVLDGVAKVSALAPAVAYDITTASGEVLINGYLVRALGVPPGGSLPVSTSGPKGPGALKP